MQASIVIPVWNGASIISGCLDAVYACSGDELLEVICVDNASHDESAALIADRYRGVHLIGQPVNLGFSGGVNAGVEAARGDVFVLLNQDCVVQPGWLTALSKALQMHSEFGIAGCTILNSDGTLNHTGALIRRPDAYGAHRVEPSDEQPTQVEFVTGAAIAIRRDSWDIIGRFDEGFYPAYYEDADYCYRARRKGIETAHVPGARVIHLLSSREWRADPLKHTSSQHQARYRFVCKHFDSREMGDFIAAECAALEVEDYFDQAAGRFIAARHTLHSLADIIERRRSDLDDVLLPSHHRQLQVGFSKILHRSFVAAEELNMSGLSEPPSEGQDAFDKALSSELFDSQAWQEANQRLQALQQREHELLERIYFRSPAAVESRERPLNRLVRLLVLRPLSLLTGREHLLLSELNTVHVARMDQMEHINSLYRAYLEQIDQLHSERMAQDRLVMRYYQERTTRRLKLLELLADYDHR